MSELSFEALELSIAALEQGLIEHEQYPQLLTVRDGVIQRFEIAMDVSRQLMIRVLKEVFSLDAASAQKDTIREAAKFGLIADAEAWMGHLAARNRTSHTYDSEIAEQVFSHIPSFLPDARDLLQRLRTHAA
ncbi:nucleotidyltransferase substrate binding protein [Sulfuricella sp. T08]|uniref:nucleotidyltransferase substrate binding protein n=1 Tax=Sulfuricella sp. T08 TaxID=1632857 RepID=UPI00061798D0|nr:nucleotidyltransferase substrate binding protein [Sulfuricella sp. T08]GAO35003.1 nucleotidyltransferase substrate binding protein [Sulfuricella sp. T08]